MQIGRFDQAAKLMVSQLLRSEDETHFLEAQTTSFSVKCNVATSAMLTVLSELFSQSRYAFTGEILEDFTTDLFLNLPFEKRAEIALKADALTTELLAKQGITMESSGAAGTIKGSQQWQTMISAKEYLDSYPQTLEVE